MINIYIRDSDRLGFSFHLFDEDTWGNDLQSFESAFVLHAYLRKAKGDLILINLSTFVRLFHEEHCEKGQVRKEAESTMIRTLKWTGKKIEDHYETVVKQLVLSEEFADTLVNSLTGTKKEKAIMQKSILYNFLKEEKREF